MPKGYHIPQCSEKDRLLIEEWAKSRTMESRFVEQAKIIRRCFGGEPIKKIARELKMPPNTLIDWRRRFDAKGISGLTDLPRSGKPPKYTVNGNQGRPKETIRRIVFALAVGAALFFCRGATAAEFAVTEASWKPESLVLYVEGTARQPDSVVLVRDAGTHALLGSAAVRTDGKWLLKIKSPKSVPYRVRAELGSRSLEYAVAGAGSKQITHGAKEIASGPAAASLSFSPIASGPPSAAEPPTAGAVVGPVSANRAKMPLPVLSLAVEIATP